MAGMSERRKSSYSSGGGTNCVAVGTTERGAFIEDTKQDRLPEARRTRLAVPASAWREFTGRVKASRG